MTPATTLGDILDTTTTIAAISTPPGTGGIAIARLTGPDAITIADKVWKGKPLAQAHTHTAHLGTVTDTDNQPLDQAIATVYIAPHSYTGQDTVEFAIHGSRYTQRQIIATLLNAGAQLARPGEFTRRAFANGNINLTQAEAIADIIGSTSRAAHRLAMSQLKGTFTNKIHTLRQNLLDLITLLELELDFSEEDVTFADRETLRKQATTIHDHIQHLADTYQKGNAIKNGIPVAIVGPTNAGKSSLLNALLDDNRAIVSDIHGTTRDTIEETTEIGDYQYRFIDTAGLRHTDDPIEQLGIERSRQAIRNAHIIISVIDATDPLPGQQYTRQIADQLQPHQTLLTVTNKTDLTTTTPTDTINISAKNRDGLDTLRQAMTRIMQNSDNYDAEDIIITNARQAQTLAKAADATRAMIQSMDNDLPTDLIAQDARAVIDTLAELTGQITTTDILSTIFSRFCIGK